MSEVVETIQCEDADALRDLRDSESLREKYPEVEYIFRPNFRENTLTVIHSPAKMMLVFAQMDAKGGFTVYRTMGVYSRLYRGDATPRAEANLRVLNVAEAKYLKGLDALQRRIREEFEPQLVDDVETPEMSAEVREALGAGDDLGFRHLYYT